jgi:hypothetical protein
MKFIELTALDNSIVYVNINHIGHIYRQSETQSTLVLGKVEEVECTRVCVTTHNNGGLKVKETPAQILARMTI